MDDNRLAEVRSFLEAERTRLLAEVAEFESDQDSLSDASGENNYRDHMADQGTATFIRDVDAALEDNVRMVLAAVERALRRIDEGTYGRCQRCGEEISAERLEAIKAYGKARGATLNEMLLTAFFRALLRRHPQPGAGPRAPGSPHNARAGCWCNRRCPASGPAPGSSTGSPSAAALPTGVLDSARGECFPCLTF